MKIYDDQLIVITGGAGFIGSCFIRYLNDHGIYNIVVVDELGISDKWRNLVGKLYYDIIEKEALFDWLKGRENQIEAFVHLGACTSTVETDASYLLENNYRFSVRLAEYALENDQRFIYASSAATYGIGDQGFSDNPDKIERLRPINMYGYSKQLFDLWVRNHGVMDKVVGLKFFNVFGPNEKHKVRMSSAIVHVLPSALKEGVIKLFKSNDTKHFADGDQKRDFVYVKDVVRMIYAFLNNDCHGIYNIGSGKASSWNELAKAVFKAIDKPTRIEYVDMPTDLLDKYQNYTCADMHRTEQAIKKDAHCMLLDDAVEDYIRNYLLTGQTW